MKILSQFSIVFLLKHHHIGSRYLSIVFRTGGIFHVLLLLFILPENFLKSLQCGNCSRHICIPYILVWKPLHFWDPFSWSFTMVEDSDKFQKVLQIWEENITQTTNSYLNFIYHCLKRNKKEGAISILFPPSPPTSRSPSLSPV